MQAKLLSLAVIAAAALTCRVADGKECKGVRFADQVQVEGTALMLNGLGLRQATFLKVNVYVGALYLPKVSNDPKIILGADAPYELILQFVRNVDGSDIKKAWSEGFERNSRAQLPALQDRVATLNGWMEDVKTGQQLTFAFKPGAGVQVSLNGSVKGIIKGDDFGLALLAIWLGAAPPNPEIKAGLLGGVCG